MTKELFLESIEALRLQSEHDSECSKAFRVILRNDHVSGYDNHWLANQLIKLLQVEFNDDHKDSWIEYYIYDLEFGKLYHEGCVTDNGTNIDLSNSDKLYEYLVTIKNRNK